MQLPVLIPIFITLLWMPGSFIFDAIEKYLARRREPLAFCMFSLIWFIGTLALSIIAWGMWLFIR